MQIENHKEEVPFSYYAGLFAELDPREAAARVPFASFDGEAFAVTLLGRSYRISWPGAEFTALDGGTQPTRQAQTFLLRLLLSGKDIRPMGQYKTFREMPWGEMYVKPFTGRVLQRAAFTFGTRVEAFRAACEELGALPLKHGDAGFQFDLTGPYTMQILVWAGDEEFPPNAQVLYSDNFISGFAAEDRVVAGDLLIGHIKSKMDNAKKCTEDGAE